MHVLGVLKNRELMLLAFIYRSFIPFSDLGC